MKNDKLTSTNQVINFCNKLLNFSSEILARIYLKKAENFDFKIKDFAKAKDFYIKAIDLKPNFEEAYLSYGYLLSNIFKDYVSAIEMFSIVIKLNPKNQLAYYKRGTCKSNLNDLVGYLNDYNEFMKLTKIDSSTYFSRAIIKSRLNDYLGVIEDCNKAIELNKADRFKFFFRGKAKFNLNYYDDAIIDFKKAIEIEIEQMKLNNHSQPFSFSTLTYYGRAKFEIKDYKGSLIIFFKCLEQHPKNHDTYELIAKVYEKLNDFENYALYMKKFNELNEKKLKNQSKTKSLKEVLITREANQERLKKVEELSNQALSSKQIEQLVNQMWLNHKRLFVNNRHTMQPEKKVLTMTENERARLQAFKNVMERIRPISQLENHEIKEEERKYFSEAHKKNSDGVMAHIAKSKTMEIDWEKELERQKWNSQDHENSIKESLAGNISREKTTNTDLTEKKTPKFQSKAHEENYKKATAYIAKSKTLEIDWEKELERQKRNSQDH